MCDLPGFLPLSLLIESYCSQLSAFSAQCFQKTTTSWWQFKRKKETTRTVTHGRENTCEQRENTPARQHTWRLHAQQTTQPDRGDQAVTCAIPLHASHVISLWIHCRMTSTCRTRNFFQLRSCFVESATKVAPSQCVIKCLLDQ